MYRKELGYWFSIQYETSGLRCGGATIYAQLQKTGIFTLGHRWNFQRRQICTRIYVKKIELWP